ncbi:hypothetical protein COHA_002266 [Chlorella ohadii]|uniref:Rhodanese domain-containing protein n=1 Tax=Chlorella ohadii TaxID=2649997 RepID=A0AAD5H864_9CHLO|nr:hypothetical protein COHA_002266 [Chlorella ohadii]
MALAGMKLARGLGGSSRLLQQSAARRLGGARRAATHPVVAALSEETRARIQERLPVTVAGLSLGSAGLPAAAHAQDGATVDQAVGSIVDLVKATGEAVKTGVSAAQTGAEYARAAYEQVAPVVKTAVETAAPVVKEGVKATVETVTPALQTGLKEAEKVLSASGVDTSAAKPLVDTTEQVVTTAKPFAEQAITFLTTTEPALLGQYAVALVAAYYLAPPLLKAGVGFLRGYAGDIAPAAALSAVESEGNAVIVDIRSAREKEAGGMPDIPNTSKLIELEYAGIEAPICRTHVKHCCLCVALVAGKLIELEYAGIEDRKVRSQLRSATDLEVKVTALQIAALKRLGKGNKILLLDRSGGGAAKAVARALSERGFGRVFVIKGGFQGWQSSKLRTKAASIVSRVEVLPPGTFGTGGSRGTGSSRSPSPAPRQLPSGSRSTQGSSGRTLAASATTVSSRRALPSPSSASQ